LKRLKEIIDEGPDLIVYGHSGGQIDWLMGTVVQILASSPNWHGRLVFSPGKQRECSDFFGCIGYRVEFTFPIYFCVDIFIGFLSGGIRAAYCTRIPKGSGIPISDALAAQNCIDSELRECGERCKHIIAQKQLVVGNELLMAWSFVFDMERPMNQKAAIHHFHDTYRRGVKKPDPSTS